jgi:hypothetical protein
MQELIDIVDWAWKKDPIKVLGCSIGLLLITITLFTLCGGIKF